MRPLILTIFLLLGCTAFTQTAEQIKQAQDQLKNLTPEQKKMMEQMGINTDPMSVIPKGTDMNKAIADQNNYIPKKDDAGIAKAKTVLNNANLSAFISSTHSTVASKMKPEAKATAEKIYKALVGEAKTGSQMGNEAAGLWMAGRIESAIYIMGKAMEMDPKNINLLNNYASMLSMCGWPEMAIPMLNKLNAETPRNSTVLNNLGQAWFGLGELDKAGKYLDSTIRIYAYHPQANMTKAAIEESKGNTAAAAEHVKKSIRHAYTQDKHNKLRKLGVKLTASDLNVRPPFKPDSDPLGLHKFSHPPIPKNLDEQRLYAGQWKAHREAISTMMDEIAEKRNAIIMPQLKKENQEMKDHLAGKPLEANGDIHPDLYDIGKIMMDAAEKDGGTVFRSKATKKALDDYAKELKKLRAEYEAEVKKLDKTGYNISVNTKKEGGEERETMCSERKQLLNKYLQPAGVKLEQLYMSYLKQLRLRLNEEVYWKQYMQWPEEFELTKLNAKSEWLGALNVYYDLVDFAEPALQHCPFEKQEIPAGYKLPDFDVVNCNLKSELYLFVGNIKIDCNVMTTKFKLGFLEAGLQQDMNKIGFEESFIGCTVKLSAAIDDPLQKVRINEIDLEIEAEAAVEFEFDRTGLKDITMGLGVDAMNNSAELKVSLVSGKISSEMETMFDNVPR